MCLCHVTTVRWTAQIQIHDRLVTWPLAQHTHKKETPRPCSISFMDFPCPTDIAVSLLALNVEQVLHHWTLVREAKRDSGKKKDNGILKTGSSSEAF